MTARAIMSQATPPAGRGNQPASASRRGDRTELSGLIRAAIERGDDKLLARISELMLSQATAAAETIGSASAASSAAAGLPAASPSRALTQGYGSLPPAAQEALAALPPSAAGAQARTYGALPAETAPATPAPVVSQPVYQPTLYSPPDGVETMAPRAQAALLERNNRQKLDELVGKTARKEGLDPALVKAVVTAESDFDPYAQSGAGAMGLMQLMPETAKDLGVTNPWDPQQNVEAGTRYLKSMLDRFGGDLNRALSAYNWGPNNVEKGGVLPRETREYVAKVLNLRRLYTEGFSTSV